MVHLHRLKQIITHLCLHSLASMEPRHNLWTPKNRLEITTLILCFSLILLVILAQFLKPALQRYGLSHKSCGYPMSEP